MGAYLVKGRIVNDSSFFNIFISFSKEFTFTCIVFHNNSKL